MGFQTPFAYYNPYQYPFAFLTQCVAPASHNTSPVSLSNSSYLTGSFSPFNNSFSTGTSYSPDVSFSSSNKENIAPFAPSPASGFSFLKPTEQNSTSVTCNPLETLGSTPSNLDTTSSTFENLSLTLSKKEEDFSANSGTCAPQVNQSHQHEETNTCTCSCHLDDASFRLDLYMQATACDEAGYFYSRLPFRPYFEYTSPISDYAYRDRHALIPCPGGKFVTSGIKKCCSTGLNVALAALEKEKEENSRKSLNKSSHQSSPSKPVVSVEDITDTCLVTGGEMPEKLSFETKNVVAWFRKMKRAVFSQEKYGGLTKAQLYRFLIKSVKYNLRSQVSYAMICDNADVEDPIIWSQYLLEITYDRFALRSDLKGLVSELNKTPTNDMECRRYVRLHADYVKFYNTAEGYFNILLANFDAETTKRLETNPEISKLLVRYRVKPEVTVEHMKSVLNEVIINLYSSKTSPTTTIGDSCNSPIDNIAKSEDPAKTLSLFPASSSSRAIATSTGTRRVTELKQGSQTSRRGSGPAPVFDNRRNKFLGETPQLQDGLTVTSSLGSPRKNSRTFAASSGLPLGPGVIGMERLPQQPVSEGLSPNSRPKNSTSTTLKSQGSDAFTQTKFPFSKKATNEGYFYIDSESNSSESSDISASSSNPLSVPTSHTNLNTLPGRTSTPLLFERVEHIGEAPEGYNINYWTDDSNSIMTEDDDEDDIRFTINNTASAAAAAVGMNLTSGRGINLFSSSSNDRGNTGAINQGSVQLTPISIRTGDQNYDRVVSRARSSPTGCEYGIIGCNSTSVSNANSSLGVGSSYNNSQETSLIRRTPPSDRTWMSPRFVEMTNSKFEQISGIPRRSHMPFNHPHQLKKNQSVITREERLYRFRHELCSACGNHFREKGSNDFAGEGLEKPLSDKCTLHPYYYIYFQESEL